MIGGYMTKIYPWGLTASHEIVSYSVLNSKKKQIFIVKHVFEKRTEN